MSLSCRIIKQSLITKKGDLKLSSYSDKVEEDIDIEDMKRIANEIIESAKIKSESIINQANIKYADIEKEAYEKGYEQGKKNGYEDGYKEIYDEYIETAKNESIKIKSQAQELLDQSNSIIAQYLKDNQKEVISSIINVVEKVLTIEFESEDCIVDMVKNIIKKYEIKENITIKCNPMYKKYIEDNLENIKQTMEVSKEVFILANDSFEQGALIIQKGSGEISISIEDSMYKLREEILGESINE
ncbi:MAG: FliH/SctL family protein [Paraclostridium sp.]